MRLHQTFSRGVRFPSSLTVTFMYKNHVENLRILDYAIEKIQIDLRKFISEQNERGEISYTRLLSYLITCWTEVRIFKLAYEPDGFNQSEIQSILLGNTSKGKWVKALDISFFKAYDLSPSDQRNKLILLKDSKDPSEKKEYEIGKVRIERFDQLQKIIETHLKSSIRTRNKIAHGQWKFVIDEKTLSLSSDDTEQVNRENIISLKAKKAIFEGLSELIHFLNVSPPSKEGNAFENFFTRYYNKINQHSTNIEKKQYSDYKLQMNKKFERGKDKKKSNQT